MALTQREIDAYLVYLKSHSPVIDTPQMAEFDIIDVLAGLKHPCHYTSYEKRVIASYRITMGNIVLPDYDTGKSFEFLPSEKSIEALDEVMIYGTGVEEDLKKNFSVYGRAGYIYSMVERYPEPGLMLASWVIQQYSTSGGLDETYLSMLSSVAHHISFNKEEREKVLKFTDLIEEKMDLYLKIARSSYNN